MNTQTQTWRGTRARTDVTNIRPSRFIGTGFRPCHVRIHVWMYGGRGADAAGGDLAVEHIVTGRALFWAREQSGASLISAGVRHETRSATQRDHDKKSAAAKRVGREVGRQA
jgi:hypothetical protein